MNPLRLTVVAMFLIPWLVAVFPRADAADLSPPPGSPDRLIDWRWLARPPEGERHVVAQLPGRPQLPTCDGGFLLLEAQGPGVLDHLLVADGRATLSVFVDGRPLWSGTMDAAIKAADDAKARTANTSFFPAPLVFGGGPLRHLIAPLGFERSLRVVVDKAAVAHFLSYRTFAPGTPVWPAAPDPHGPYAKGLQAAAGILQAGVTFPERAFPKAGTAGVRPPVAASASPASGFVANPTSHPNGSAIPVRSKKESGNELPHSRRTAKAQEWKKEFVLRANSHETVLDAPGSGEIVHLEVHASPALSGSLREVVVELRYDGAAEPAVRLPLPELVGVAHPWIVHRWHTYNGTLAAGLQYPWFVHVPRFHFPEDTFHFNLPVPFANGVRLDLVNRSEKMRFTGFVRALAMPLSEPDAERCGRLCALRAVGPVTVGADPQPLLRVPGAGHLVGFGLFTTGGDAYPPAVHNFVLSLVRDGGPPVLGQGVVPLWFMGAYGGSIGNQPIWNHPLYDDNFAGVMRYFLTDPLPFAAETVFGFTPGTNEKGAPTAATALAFWYRFGTTPFTAPPLPEHAEPLPHSTFGTHAAQKDSRLFWEIEAEDLVPQPGRSHVVRSLRDRLRVSERLANVESAPDGGERPVHDVAAAQVHGGAVRVEEDNDHNYHPSAGKYLHYVADRAGDYVDCLVPFPPTRYFAVGTGALWGPNRGTFEMDVLSRQEAQSPPEFLQGDEFYRGRVLGHVPMRAPVFVGQDLRSLRDTGTEYPVPFLNPAPDQRGVVRFICQSKPLDSTAFLLKLDKVRLDLPPATAAGWREFEDLVDPAVSGGLTARRPKQGRFEWSGWGAVVVTSPPGGKAVFRTLLPAGQPQVSEVIMRGSLNPQQGAWQARVLQPEAPASAATPLAPGKDEKEVVEWRVSVTGLRLPGPVLIEFTCAEAGPKAEPARAMSKAELVLDAWATRY